jgi:hypothetical protein
MFSRVQMVLSVSLMVINCEMALVCQVHPLLSDLVLSLGRVPQLPVDFEGKVKGREWIARLNKMLSSIHCPNHHRHCF